MMLALLVLQHGPDIDVVYFWSSVLIDALPLTGAGSHHRPGVPAVVGASSCAPDRPTSIIDVHRSEEGAEAEESGDPDAP